MTYISTPGKTEILPGVFQIVRGGCIRLGQKNSWGGPYWHINLAHSTMGFQVDEENPRVELTDDNLGIVVRSVSSGLREEVLSVCAAPDESMARQRLTSGGSGGIGTTIISTFKTGMINGGIGTTLINPRSMSEFPADNCNIWLTIVTLGYAA